MSEAEGEDLLSLKRGRKSTYTEEEDEKLLSLWQECLGNPTRLWHKADLKGKTLNSLRGHLTTQNFKEKLTERGISLSNPFIPNQP